MGSGPCPSKERMTKIEVVNESDEDPPEEVPPEVKKVKEEISTAVEERLLLARTKLLEMGHADEDIHYGPLSIDSDVIYVTVRKVPVHRICVCYNYDTVHVVASWLFGNLNDLEAN